MMLSKYFVKTSKVFLASLLMYFSFLPAANAEWFSVNVAQIVPRADGDGDIFVQVVPAPGETGFSGLSRIVVDGTAPGANRMMAVLLSGLALNKVVTVFVDNPPSFDNPQILQSTGITSN